MSATPPSRDTMLSDNALYGLCQAIGWSLLAGVIYYFGADPLSALGYTALITGTGLAISHGLHTLVKRGNWLNRPLAYWIPRLAVATVACALVWWFVVDVTENVIANSSSLGEAIRSTIQGDIFGLNRLTAALHVIVLALWSALYVAGHALRKHRAAEIVAWQRTAEVREAELRALHAQLNPHFLFNALNSLRALIAEQPAQAQDAVTSLARLLRYTLRTSQLETVPLEAEMEAVRDYLALETLRFEDRLQVEVAVEARAGSLRVPPLLVLTLVENAVKHGVSPRPEGGVVSLEAHVDGGLLAITVRNPGTLLPAPVGEGGHGLRNVRERLRLLFGEDAALCVEGGDGAGVVAEVYLPAQR